MEDPTQKSGGIGGVVLSGDRYTVKQSLIRSKYKVYDEAGDLVLKSKKKRFKMKEEFPFFDADGNVVFRVKAKNFLDVAGDYVIVEEGSDDPILVLSKNFTFFHHDWTLKRPDGTLVAEIASRSALLEALRSVVDVLSFLPHKYSITTPDGESVGQIAGKFSFRDQYDIHIDDAGTIPKTALVVGAIAIDALEGN
ncbi:hypothetical protein [Haladaptatus sp. NG-SE-30]